MPSHNQATAGKWDAINPIFFTRAKRYSPAPELIGTVREAAARFRAYPYTERHLQCVWFDPALRPPLRSSAGEEIIVEDAGTWNLEAGPDFLGAALRIGPERRRISGDVEIHIHPSDWQHHRHAADPRYANVRAHVTYFPGALPLAELPPGAVQISLKETLSIQPGFSFENIDTTLYPFAARAAVPPCLQVLQHWPADAKDNVLKAAGEERLRRKSERLAQQMAEKGEGQAVYEEVMTALGYKHNKRPFRRLAELVPLDVLRDEAKGKPHVAYALLLGVAGMLPADTLRAVDDETRSFIRQLWDAWWKRKDRWDKRTLEKKDWRLAGLRPANHPARRLMAAAFLFTREQSLDEVWHRAATGMPATCGAAAAADLQAATGTYWDYRLSFAGRKLAEPVALIGKDRAEAIVINVMIPMLAAMGEETPFRHGLLDAMPAEGDHAVIRQTAFNLFGSYHAASIYRGGMQRQGLVQIFHDYCLNDRSRCASCAFPNLLRGWSERSEE